MIVAEDGLAAVESVRLHGTELDGVLDGRLPDMERVYFIQKPYRSDKLLAALAQLCEGRDA